MHIVRDMPHGADCSCGKVFSVWRQSSRGYTTSQDKANRVPITRANAHRHADAANRKEAMKQLVDKLQRLSEGVSWEESMISDFSSNVLERVLPHLTGLPEVQDMVTEELEMRSL